MGVSHIFAISGEAKFPTGRRRAWLFSGSSHKNKRRERRLWGISGITSHIKNNEVLRGSFRWKSLEEERNKWEPAAVPLLLSPTTPWKADFLSRAGCSPNKGPRVLYFYFIFLELYELIVFNEYLLLFHVQFL